MHCTYIHLESKVRGSSPHGKLLVEEVGYIEGKLPMTEVERVYISAIH